MATTATTPSELLIAIDTTVRNQTTPNSITPITHSDLLYNVVEVLSANTYTTGGTYISSASTIDFSTNGVNYSVDLSELDDNYLPLTGGTITGNINTNTLTVQTLGTGTSVTNLGIDSSGNVVSGTTNGTGPLRYKALLTQSGTDAPVSTVLENSLGGEIVWSRDGVGRFIGTLIGVFSLNKTFLLLGTVTDGDTTLSFGSNLVRLSIDELELATISDSGGRIDGVLNNTSILIEVYP